MFRVITGEPTIAIIAEPMINPFGVGEMIKWVEHHRPECLPDRGSRCDGWFQLQDLFPHDMKREDGFSITDAEALAELAGRKCYDSFGAKGGRKSNAEYLAHTQEGEVPHRSILYHPKFTFFFAGVSRRVSHEFIRNYVGSDRDEEGSPSQESTRYTEHYGWFIAHPRLLEPGREHYLELFTVAMKNAYDLYLGYIINEVGEYKATHDGQEPKGMDRKRIYECASGFLPHSCETSWIWTTNPVAIAKFVQERAHEAADLEMQRFAKKLRRVVVQRWPNLFPQPWMKIGS